MHHNGPMRYLPQGMYEVATLALCETMDELGMSKEASVLEASLGTYWEVTAAEAHEAKQQAQTQVCL